MADWIERELVADLSRDVVMEIAPQELPTFRAMSRAYTRDPAALRQVRQQRAGKEEPLAFGASEAVVLLTPVVLEVMGNVVAFLASELMSSSSEESPSMVGARVRRLFKRFHGEGADEGVTPLTRKQLEQVRALALEQACRFELPADEAGKLADALVGKLVVSGA